MRPRIFEYPSSETKFEQVIRFLDWARSKRRVPEWREIQTFLGCSRATASRYRRALLATQGLQ